MNRQIVKAHTASINIPELELEIPAITQSGKFLSLSLLASVIFADKRTLRLYFFVSSLLSGTLNTVEGFIIQTIDALQGTQEERAVRLYLL
jgi:C4-type Zn-finger protein